MAAQRGSALAGSPGKEGWRRSGTRSVIPSCVVVAATLGTKRCLPGSSPAWRREKGVVEVESPAWQP